MFFACFGLLAKGLKMLGVVGDCPIWVNGVVFVVIFSVVMRSIMKHVKTGS
jgi:hypothetical protein